MSNGSKTCSYKDGRKQIIEHYDLHSGEILSKETIYPEGKARIIERYEAGHVTSQTVIATNMDDIRTHIGTSKVISGIGEDLNIFGGHYDSIYTDLIEEIGDTNVWKNIEFTDHSTKQTVTASVRIPNTDEIEIKFNSQEGTEYLLHIRTEEDGILTVHNQELFIDGIPTRNADNNIKIIPKTVAPQDACEDALQRLNNGTTNGIVVDAGRQGSFFYYFSTEYNGQTIYWRQPIGSDTVYPLSTTEMTNICRENTQIKNFFNFI